MPIDETLAALTRSLIAGVSLGGIALTQVGCVSESPMIAQSQAERSIEQLDGSERAMCARALRSKSVRDVNALMRAHPASRCIAPLLGALPASVLSALSAAAVSNLAASVVSAFPMRVSANLPTSGRVAEGRGSRSGSERSDADTGQY